MAMADLDRQGPASRGLLGVMLAALACATPVQAADRYQLDTLGYSQDGRYFAFEQFAIQDGSGFPVSEIYLIDLDTDRFVASTPVTARINDENAALSAARDQARAAAADALTAHDISRPATPVALHGDGELGDEKLSLGFGLPTWGLAETQGEYRLSLDIFKAPTGEDCVEWFGEPAMGYALTLGAKAETREVHRDIRMPTSRGCPITYKLYGVFLPFEAYDLNSAVAVISVWSHGFEGPDRTFIALPIGMRE